MGVDPRAFVSRIAIDPEVLQLEVRLWRRYLEKQLGGRLPEQDADRLVHPSVAWNVQEHGQAIATEEDFVTLFSASSSPWIHESVAYTNADIVQQGEGEAALRFREGDLAVAAAVDAARDALRCTLADSARLVDTFVACVVACSSDAFVGCSMPRALGTVYMNPTPEWSLAMYVDTLVHEASHMELFVRQLVAPLVVGSRMLGSPFRKHTRPQLAVLHAGFVLARVCDALAALVADESTPERDAARALLADNSRLLTEAAISLEQADLTPAGQALLAEVTERARTHRGWDVG